MQLEEKPNRIRFAGLFLRGGLFHAVLDLPLAGCSIEVVLHGISTLEEAMKAVGAFRGSAAVPAMG
jgi:hypothetical protein